MTKDEIIEMAREAGAGIGTSGRWLVTQDELERFAELVAAKERYARQEKSHPLTDKQILDLGPGQPDAVWNYDSQVYFARAIEHAHGIE